MLLYIYYIWFYNGRYTIQQVLCEGLGPKKLVDDDNSLNTRISEDVGSYARWVRSEGDETELWTI